MAEPWDVDVDWMWRRMGRARARFAEWMHDRRNQRGRPPRDHGDGWGDLLWLPDEPGCLGPIVVVFAVVALVALVIAGAPVVGAVLVWLFETVWVLLASLVVLAFRVTFRRPWRVVARSREETVRWRIVGYRRARGLVAEIRAAVAAGHHPATVFPDAQTSP